MNQMQSIIRLTDNPKGFGDHADELSQGMFASEIPLQHSHDFYADEERGIYIGLWDTTDMIEVAAPYDMDEFMIILEGAAIIKNNQSQKQETINAGESFIIPKGYDCQWLQQGYLRKFYVIAEVEQPSEIHHENVIRLASDMAIGHKISYKNSRSNFSSGIYHGTAQESPLSSSNSDYFIYLKQGELMATDQNNNKHHFKAGDAFVVLKNARLTWASNTPILHHYVELPSK